MPSLSSDSPVMIIVRPALAPNDLSSATTATGSVAARIAPKVMHMFMSHS